MRSLRICICAMLCIVLVSCSNETNLENVKKGKTTGAISSIATDSKKMTINVMQDKMAGYPQGTMGEYQRYICSDKNKLYVVNNLERNCSIVQLSKDGTDLATIYVNGNGNIYAINTHNNWIVFQLVEFKDGYENYYICRIKNDGTKFKKIREERINDLWMYESNIFYSQYTKWGGSNLYSMDIDGKKRKLIFEMETGLEFEVVNNTIYICCYDRIHESLYDCELYKMDLSGAKRIKVADIKEAYSDTIFLWGNYVYYINDEQQLCKMKLDSIKVEILASDVDKYCVYKGYIYYTTYDEEPTKLYKINLSGKEKKLLNKSNIVKMNYFDVILDDWIYFISDNMLIRINCVGEKSEKIKLNKTESR